MVVAQAHTDSTHPLKHAVMVCIDNVANGQGGGAWSNEMLPSQLQASVALVAGNYSMNRTPSGSQQGCDTRMLPISGDQASREISRTEEAATYCTEDHSKETSECCKGDSELDSIPLPPQAKRSKLSSQYLCTGYDTFVTKEPCIM